MISCRGQHNEITSSTGKGSSSPVNIVTIIIIYFGKEGGCQQNSDSFKNLSQSVTQNFLLNFTVQEWIT